MNVYEIINPSDETTCEAESLAVAAFSAVLLSPHYGVKNVDNEEERFFEFFAAVDAFTAEWGEPKAFLESHALEIASCLESFAYLSARERTRYKRALELIDDPEKRRIFRDEHEDQARSSVNRICKAAWAYAKDLREANSSPRLGDSAVMIEV